MAKMSDLAAALELERETQYSTMAWLERRGWTVGRYALAPVKPRQQPQPQQRRGILARIDAIKAVRAEWRAMMGE